MAKILIIKTGHSETLDHDLSTIVSLGDVLRTTPILHLYKNDEVTWLVDAKAVPLLEGNAHIAHLLVYDAAALSRIRGEDFDIVINLEKGEDLCRLMADHPAKKKYGFYCDCGTHEIQAYPGAEEALAICRDAIKKKNNRKYWQQILIELLGNSWSGQEYIFSPRHTTKELFDIGFNYFVGKKWPTKEWPREHWDELARMFKATHSFSYQQGMNNLDDYIQWIDSCRLLITCDSLGAHLALALKKKVLILYGPTASAEMYLYQRGYKLVADASYTCMPCFQGVCGQAQQCITSISASRVQHAVQKLLSKSPHVCDDVFIR